MYSNRCKECHAILIRVIYQSYLIQVKVAATFLRVTIIKSATSHCQINKSESKKQKLKINFGKKKICFLLEIWRTVKQVRSELTFLLMFPLLFPLFPLPLSSPAYLCKSRKKKRNTKLISNVFFLGAWMSYQVQILLNKSICRRQGGVTKYKYKTKYK